MLDKRTKINYIIKNKHLCITNKIFDEKYFFRSQNLRLKILRFSKFRNFENVKFVKFRKCQKKLSESEIL